jgi:hypothetical protein
MTIVGGTVVNYAFDNYNRLSQIAQGVLTVAYAYGTPTAKPE